MIAGSPFNPVKEVLVISFTRQVKHELSRQDDKPPCCSPWELVAFILMRGSLRTGNNSPVLNIRVDYNIVARYLFSLLKSAGVDSPSVAKQQGKRLGKSCFVVQVAGAEQVAALLLYLQLKAARLGRVVRTADLAPHRRCCRQSFIRGAFLAAGSISITGRSGYHLEINCSNPEEALAIKDHLAFYSIDAFLRRHNGCFNVYLKKAEAIADFLRVSGANSALMSLENFRVVKSMRNQVNRLVNCDTANLEKVITSAQQQLRLIERLDQRAGLNNLPPLLAGGGPDQATVPRSVFEGTG